MPEQRVPLHRRIQENKITQLSHIFFIFFSCFNIYLFDLCLQQPSTPLSENSQLLVFSTPFGRSSVQLIVESFLEQNYSGGHASFISLNLGTEY